MRYHGKVLLPFALCLSCMLGELSTGLGACNNPTLGVSGTSICLPLSCMIQMQAPGAAMFCMFMGVRIRRKL